MLTSVDLTERIKGSNVYERIRDVFFALFPKPEFLSADLAERITKSDAYEKTVNAFHLFFGPENVRIDSRAIEFVNGDFNPFIRITATQEQRYNGEKFSATITTKFFTPDRFTFEISSKRHKTILNLECRGGIEKDIHLLLWDPTASYEVPDAEIAKVYLQQFFRSLGPALNAIGFHYCIILNVSYTQFLEKIEGVVLLTASDLEERTGFEYNWADRTSFFLVDLSTLRQSRT